MLPGLKLVAVIAPFAWLVLRLLIVHVAEPVGYRSSFMRCHSVVRTY
jgi:hypothetical protein